MKFADLAPGASITLGPETITETVRWRRRVCNQLAAVVLDLEATSLFEISAETAAAPGGRA